MVGSIFKLLESMGISQKFGFALCCSGVDITERVYSP